MQERLALELGQRWDLLRMSSEGIGVQDRVVASFETTRSVWSELAQILVDEVLELVDIGLVPEEVNKVCQLVLPASLLKFLLQLLFVNQPQQVVLVQNASGHALLASQVLMWRQTCDRAPKATRVRLFQRSRPLLQFLLHFLEFLQVYDGLADKLFVVVRLLFSICETTLVLTKKWREKVVRELFEVLTIYLSSYA